MNLASLQNIKPLKVTSCAVCERPLSQPLLSFPEFPLTEIYLPEKPAEKIGFLDLHFHLCPYCGHGQLSNYISPEVLYENSYYFRTSSSSTASQANDVFLSFINATLGDRKVNGVMEMGCSDLYLLRALKSRAAFLWGIDPVLKGKEQEFNDDKIRVKGDFFENVNLREYDFTDSIVLSSHTLEHIQNPKPIIKNLLHHAAPSTIFFFQFPGFEALVEHNRFDQIFHQHVQYFSLHSFQYLLEELGGEMISSAINYQHWGSLLLAFQKKQNDNTKLIDSTMVSSDRRTIKSTEFSTQSRTGGVPPPVVGENSGTQKEPPRAKRASHRSLTGGGRFLFENRKMTAPKITREQVLQKYTLFQQQMKMVSSSLQSLEKNLLVGYGAALMLPVLGYHLGLDFSNFAFIADDDKKKQGLYYANLPVPVRSTAEITDLSSTTIVITAIDNSRQILPKALAMQPKRIIMPLGSI